MTQTQKTMEIENLKANPKWHLITIDTIDDPLFLSGKIFCDLIQLLLKVIPFRYGILDAVQGSGKGYIIFLLQQKRDVVRLIDKIFRILLRVENLEWGDFFLFKEYPRHWKNPEGELYPYVIAQSDTTLRAIDGRYIYIYTPYQEVVELVKANYEIESLTTDTLENLEYPY
jgi:hypothetical protein